MPIDHRVLLEQAHLDALGLLDPDEASAFAVAFKAAPAEVQEQIRREQARLASLDTLLPDIPPADELRDRVIQAVRAALTKEMKRTESAGMEIQRRKNESPRQRARSQRKAAKRIEKQLLDTAPELSNQMRKAAAMFVISASITIGGSRPTRDGGTGSGEPPTPPLISTAFFPEDDEGVRFLLSLQQLRDHGLDIHEINALLQDAATIVQAELAHASPEATAHLNPTVRDKLPSAPEDAGKLLLGVAAAIGAVIAMNMWRLNRTKTKREIEELELRIKALQFKLANEQDERERIRDTLALAKPHLVLPE